MLTSWQKWYAKNKKRHVANNKILKKEAQLRNKTYVNEKKCKPCADCQIQYPPCVMQEEIDKCEVVCANCHCIRTHGRLVQQ